MFEVFLIAQVLAIIVWIVLARMLYVISKELWKGDPDRDFTRRHFLLSMWFHKKDDAK